MAKDKDGWLTVDLDATKTDNTPQVEVETETGELTPQELDAVKNKADTPPEGGEDAPKQSDRVQKRINELTRKWKTEAEEKARLAAEVAQLRGAVAQSQKVTQTFVAKSFEDRESGVKATLESTKQALKAAVEKGDTDAQIELQERLADLKAEQKLISAQKASFTQEAEEAKTAEAQTQQRQQTQQVQTPRFAPKTQAWLDANPVVKTDPVVASVTAQVAAELEAQGYDPTEDEYFQEIEKRLAKELPTRFKRRAAARDEDDEEEEVQVREEKPKATAFGRPSRSGGGSTKGSRRVVLTKAQVAVARKFGMTPEEYAAQMLAIENAGDGAYVNILETK